MRKGTYDFKVYLAIPEHVRKDSGDGRYYVRIRARGAKPSVASFKTRREAEKASEAALATWPWPLVGGEK